MRQKWTQHVEMVSEDVVQKLILFKKTVKSRLLIRPHFETPVRTHFLEIRENPHF